MDNPPGCREALPGKRLRGECFRRGWIQRILLRGSFLVSASQPAMSGLVYPKPFTRGDFRTPGKKYIFH